MRKAVITGANGFVGSWIVKYLAESGVKVYAVVRNNEEDVSSISHPENVEIICCDLSRVGSLPEQIKERDIDVFFHLAWAASAGDGRADCDLQLNNARCSCDAVKAAHAMGCRRFLFASSLMEYECAHDIASGDAMAAKHIYSAAKIAAHYMGNALANGCGMDFVAVIISNIYGIGESSPRLVNTAIRKLLRNEKTAFTAGEQMYDFIYIKDAARAFIEIADKGKNNRNYYLGSLSPQPLKNYLHIIGDVVAPGRELGIGLMPYEGRSLDYSEAFDIEAVKNDTGFIPAYSFADGVKETAEWIRECI